MTASKPLIPAYWHRPLAAFVLLLVVILAAYWHSAWAMAMTWTRSGAYARGFVVPLIP